MAEESKISPETKETLIKGAVYIGGGIILLGAVKRLLFGGPGPTTRVPASAINYHDTQVRRVITNAPNPGDYVEVDSPWSPVQLANELHTAMVGLNRMEYGVTDRSEVWLKVAQLGTERAKWLHNYWLDHVDAVDTLYRWIASQTVLRWSEEHDRREQAKEMLKRAQIGF